MQKIVIVANGAPYGSESLFNSLRLAIALREQESNLDLRLFLMSDAVTAGLRGQKPGEGYNIQQMLEILTAQNVPWKSVLLWNWRNGRCQPIKCSHFNV
jgi:uncharacterized protein involved in oxidation of intracellular sulfur